MNDTAKDAGPISFELNPEHARALQSLSGNRGVRLSGIVQGGKLVVNFIACNAAFVACNIAFSACNSPFTACNSPFKG